MRLGHQRLSSRWPQPRGLIVRTTRSTGRSTWLSSTFADVAVDLHSVAEDDEGRVLVSVTLHGTHIGSAFPLLRERAPADVAWPGPNYTSFVPADAIVERWAVRGDLQLLEAIDLVL